MTAMLAELSERTLRSAMSTLHSITDESGDCASFIAAALELLPRMVTSDLTTLSICDLERGHRRVVGREGEALSPSDVAAFDQHFGEHPLVRFHGTHPGGPTQRISDCVDIRAFHNSALHADYYRRIGMNFVMALPLRIDRTHVISVVFNRSRCDFNDMERAAIDAIRQPLAVIYRNLIAREEAGIGLKRIGRLAGDGGWQTMRVSMGGRILDASAAVFTLLRRFFPQDSVGPKSQLPISLSEWFARSRCWGLERPAMTQGAQFTTSRLGMKLTIHFVPDPDDGSAGFFLMKSERLDLRAAYLAALPLTDREREILVLVAGGKINAEIGMILSISARTAQKHLEHIFQKLGVETRTAAAVSALAAADEHIAAA